MNRKCPKKSKDTLYKFLSSLATFSLLGTCAIPVNAATKVYTFPASTEQTQTLTFDLPTDLVSVNSVKSNTGIATYSVEGGKIKITVTDGNPASKESFYNDKLHLLPDYTATIYSDTNNFSNTINYVTPDGYSGTLTMSGSAYVSDGEEVSGPKMDISVTQKSPVNDFPATISYEKDLFKGILNKSGTVQQIKVSGDSYSKDSKTATTTIKNSTNSFSSTTTYDDGTYRGTLSKNKESEKYVASGTLTKSETKIANQSQTSNTNSFPSTISYSDSSGFKGTLKKTTDPVTSKLVSGEAPKSLEVYTRIGPGICDDHFYWNSNTKKWEDNPDGYLGGSWVEPQSGALPIASGEFKGLDVIAGFDHSTATTTTGTTHLQMQITKNGYKYTGKLVSVAGTSAPCDTGGKRPTHTGKTHMERYTIRGTIEYREFSGTLKTADTRKYEYTQKYSGNVTKPEVDTRVWAYKQDYSGEATRYLKVTETLQSDTNSFPSSITYENQNGYKGTLSKSGNAVLDDDVYEQNYTGYIYSQSVDNREYEYSQLYKGTVSQENEDNRVWAADYTGTLYKGGDDYRNEQYAYTVTLDYGTEKTSNCSYLGVSPSSTTILNFIPKCTTIDDGTKNLYSFYYDFKVTGISNIQAGK